METFVQFVNICILKEFIDIILHEIKEEFPSGISTDQFEMELSNNSDVLATVKK